MLILFNSIMIIVQEDTNITIFKSVDEFLVSLCKRYDFYRGKNSFSENIDLMAYEIDEETIKDSAQLDKYPHILGCSRKYGWVIKNNEIKAKLSAIACALDHPWN